jgi:hypothetical protein
MFFFLPQGDAVSHRCVERLLAAVDRAAVVTGLAQRWQRDGWHYEDMPVLAAGSEGRRLDCQE